MHLLTPLLALLTLAAAVPRGPPEPASDLAAFSASVRKMLDKRALSIGSCENCKEPLEVCMKYGVANELQKGCDRVCVEYVCLRWPECGKCGDPFHCDVQHP